jgi:hypothetical protein
VQHPGWSPVKWGLFGTEIEVPDIMASTLEVARILWCDVVILERFSAFSVPIGF